MWFSHFDVRHRWDEIVIECTTRVDPLKTHILCDKLIFAFAQHSTAHRSTHTHTASERSWGNQSLQWEYQPNSQHRLDVVLMLSTAMKINWFCVVWSVGSLHRFTQKKSHSFSDGTWYVGTMYQLIRDAMTGRASNCAHRVLEMAQWLVQWCIQREWACGIWFKRSVLPF